MSFDLIATAAGLLGVSVREFATLVAAAGTTLSAAAVEKREKRRNAMLPQLLADGRVDMLLRAYYGDSMPANVRTFAMTVAGRRVDTAIAGTDEAMTLAVPLGGDAERCVVRDRVWPSSPASSSLHVLPVDNVSPAEVAAIVAAIQRRGRDVWDQPIYRLRSSTLTDTTLACVFSVDRFLRYRFTNGALYDETIDALVGADGDIGLILNEPSRFLPIRNRLVPTYDSVVDFDRSLCVGGTPVTLAMARADEGDFVIPIAIRSAKVSASQGFLSVVPQAFHQPVTNAGAEARFSNTVFRELHEELFGGHEADRDVRKLRWDWYYGINPALGWFRRNVGSYTMLATGLMFSLLNASYECPVLLVVDDPGYWEEFGAVLEANWEAEHIFPLYTDDSRNEESIASAITDRAWTGEGLMSLVRALQWLRDNRASRVNIPPLMAPRNAY